MANAHAMIMGLTEIKRKETREGCSTGKAKQTLNTERRAWALFPFEWNLYS